MGSEHVTKRLQSILISPAFKFICRIDEAIDHIVEPVAKPLRHRHIHGRIDGGREDIFRAFENRAGLSFQAHTTAGNGSAIQINRGQPAHWISIGNLIHAIGLINKYAEA